MKKTLLLTVMGAAAISAAAQQAIEQPGVFDNWSIGVNGGATTPLVGHPFFGSMRGIFGATLAKQISPIIGLGAEGLATVNTSSWGTKSPTVIDETYFGVYGTIDLMNLFCGYQCEVRPFSLEAVAGVGWGHDYWPKAVRADKNFAASKAGLNFNFNVSDNVTFMLQPSVMWNMTEANVSQTTAAYNAKRATFNIMAGVKYNIGGHQFNCVVPMDPALIEALNDQVNDLRLQVADANANAASWKNKAAALADQLQNAPQSPTIIKETVVTEVNNLNSVRYVFFKIGSSAITPDQMPNVEMIASYLKNHPDATVAIKGYASKDGPEELNIKLAQARAQSVKDALVKKYGINASRISAEGQGIGNMFDEESWNRVSICTIENPNL